MTAYRKRHAQRGQAIMETAVFLPMFLIVLFGVIWIIQQSVLDERMQIAVRYSGLVSNTANMYSEYSLYALYGNLESPAITEVTGCVTPGLAEIINAAPFPGPTTAAFWQPTTVASATCAPGTVVMTGGAFVQPALFQQTLSGMNATTTTPAFLTEGSNPLTASQQLAASQNFFEAPDMYQMLNCFPGVASTVKASLIGVGGSTAVPPALIPTTPVASQLTLNPGC